MKTVNATHPLETLTHHRWAIPIIALLHTSGGAKFVTLVNALQISRDALSRSLNALLEAGWIMHNPGYGHPLRPEYLLTLRGAKIGEAAAALQAWLERNNAQTMLLKKWSLPILLQVQNGQTHFTKIQQHLPGITPRALTLGLEELRAGDFVLQQDRDYRLSESGAAVTKLAATLEAALRDTT
jgi:DNA-binding HxlR family transcriptional regulator